MGLKLLADAVGDLGDIEAAIPVVAKVAAAVKAGQPINLTTDEGLTLEKLVNDGEQLVADAKASFGDATDKTADPPAGATQ